MKVTFWWIIGLFLAAVVLMGFAAFIWPKVFSPGDALNLMAFLALIIALVGAANYLLLQMTGEEIEALRKQILEENAKNWEKERSISKSQMARTLGISHLEIYEYENVRDGAAHDKGIKHGSKRLAQINNALLSFRDAIAYIDEIDINKIGEKDLKKRILRELLINENNLVHCLTRKWGYYRGTLTPKQFKGFLEKPENRELAKDYIADKTRAEAYLSETLRPENLHYFDDLVEPFKGTERIAKDTFAVELAIPAN